MDTRTLELQEVRGVYKAWTLSWESRLLLTEVHAGAFVRPRDSWYDGLRQKA